LKEKVKDIMASKKSVSRMTGKRRLIFFFSAVSLMFLIIAARTGYIQIVKADDYSNRALTQQTKDLPITARRGNIYDTNMKALAINQSTSTIWVRPSDVKEQEEKNPGFTENMAAVLAEILGDKTEDEIYETITKDSSLLKLAKYVDDEKTEKIREAMKDSKDPDTGEKIKATVAGIQIAETPHRYYPMGEFASHVIGATNDDNSGMFGLELYYDQYLTGTEGRWIRSTDGAGRSLTNGEDKYYSAEDGYSIVLTIDEIIQHYVEKAIKQVQANTNALRTMAIVMDPKTGDILAMASYPDFDLNDPRTPLSTSEQEKLEGMTDAEKVEYWNDMWRNPLINDTYEPGSPFKLLTTSMALEEGLTSVSDTFVCKPVNLYGQVLKCWKTSGSHGTETLAQGVANSCNPVFIALSQRLGISKFYEYLDAYGFTGTTGIDYPGEATSILQNQNSAGPVGLATMSYGQGLACTPIRLITALCSNGNEGKMMQPRFVRAIANSDGDIIEEFDPVVVRRIVSKQTADDICYMMEGVVSSGTGSEAYLPGYRVGGKTGTAQKVVNGRYTSDTYSSFFAMAPMDDPQVAVLVIVDSPQGVHYGSKTAGPGVRMILEDTLQYMGVEPVYTDSELSAINKSYVTVPDLTGKSYESASETLKKLNLTPVACPGGETEFTVIDQYPKAGTQITEGNSVCLYKE
jgi:stage V sporulation protein D (sporulation-specific penicillin-binding protein)